MSTVKLVKDTSKRTGRPGVRGPDKSKAERLAPKTVIVVDDNHPNNIAAYNEAKKAGLVPADHKSTSTDNTYHKRTVNANKTLEKLIRQIGDEVVDEQTGWTRIVAVIRRLYADAMSGKTQAQALLFERGWGKPLIPVEVDVRSELQRIVTETGLTEDDIQSDPLLRELFVEGDFREVLVTHYGDNALAPRAGTDQLVRSSPLSDGPDKLLEPERVVEDGRGS